MRVSCLRFVLGALLAAPVAAATVGQMAPDFAGQGADGKSYKLADFQGRFVVLEWHNANCPYVKKHYQPGHMQRLQKEWTGKGAVWLKVLSSKAGKQGAVTAEQELEYNKHMGASATASLMDTDQSIARAYSARTTPHMFVIDPRGKLIYNGALDDKSGSNPEEVKTARNHVAAALGQAMSGKPVSEPSTKPYGCSVKY